MTFITIEFILDSEWGEEDSGFTMVFIFIFYQIVKNIIIIIYLCKKFLTEVVLRFQHMVF